MTRFEAEEANAFLGEILDALLATLEGRIGRSFMEARNKIGFLRGYSAARFEEGNLSAALLECFDLCREAGATRAGMDGVRKAMVVKQPKYIPGTMVALTGIFFSLQQQARLVSAITYTSREDIDATLITMHAIFAPAEDFAATNIADPQVYDTMVGLHAALSSDLNERALPLPRIVKYRFPTRMPSVKLAMRIYGDARRADELVKINRVVHPSFCLAAGKCLSN